MQERIKTVSEHAHEAGHYPLWNEINCVPHWHTRRVKGNTLHPNNINRDNGIQIPEERMPMVKKNKRKLVQ